jgi:AAA15 family ATPase/GTPase
MLTRVYIDNFRCFVNFEFRPASRQLILGGNGSGKSSFMDALLLLRRFAIDGDTAAGEAIVGQQTRWLNKSTQKFQIEATLDGQSYIYRLDLEPTDHDRARVKYESVQLAGKTLFTFKDSEVDLYDDNFESKSYYEANPHRSMLAVLTPRSDNVKLSRFQLWFSELFGFRINPFAMGARAENEIDFPDTDLTNIANWYRHLVQTDPKANTKFLASLRACLDGFDFLQLSAAGENVRVLRAEFETEGDRRSNYSFAELSEGQRCLISLYMILSFVVANGKTVLIDEPENFISLREIQPWLMAASDVIQDTGGQLLLVSHHPELINQWAPDFGVRFVRENGGPARIERFQGDPDGDLSPAELVARGWENG